MRKKAAVRVAGCVLLAAVDLSFRYNEPALREAGQMGDQRFAQQVGRHFQGVALEEIPGEPHRIISTV